MNALGADKNERIEVSHKGFCGEQYRVPGNKTSFDLQVTVGSLMFHLLDI